MCGPCLGVVKFRKLLVRCPRESPLNIVTILAEDLSYDVVKITDTCATFFMRRARCAAGRISRVPVRELLSNCVHATCGATLAVHPLLLLIKACARAVVGNFIVKRQRCAATPQRRVCSRRWPA